MRINQAGAHLDQMIRQTRNHHVQLSTMADTKANMLLTTATIVLTLSVSYITDDEIKWAAIILICFSLLTIFLAIYAVMPKVPVHAKTQKYEKFKKTNMNLLFFGDFIHLDYKEFEIGMEELLNDHSKVYEAQVKEIYTLGKFLAIKKYRYLRLAYICFVTGLFTSVGFILLPIILT